MASCLISFHKRDNYFELKFSGSIDIDDLIQNYRKCFTSPEFKRGAGLLANLTDSESHIDFSSIEKLFDFASEYADLDQQKYRSAVLVSDKIDASYFELWRIYSAKLPNEEYEVFIDHNKAKKWLRRE